MTTKPQHPIATDSADPVRRELRALGAKPLPDRGFRSQLHRRLVESGPPPAPGFSPWDWLRERASVRTVLLWPTLGCVCGVVTYMALAKNPPPISPPRPVASAMDQPAGDVTAIYPIPVSKVAVVKLSFSAEVAIEDVTFEVALPDGLFFWSRGQRLAERTFTWPGHLLVGDNLVPIAVRGERPGRYLIRARVIIDGQPVEHAVMLDVRGSV